MNNKIIVIAALLLVVFGVGYFVINSNSESTDDATIEADIATISPKVSGYIKAVNVTDNQLVKAGDVLLEIDPSDYIIKVDHAKAVLDAAKAAYNASGHNLDSTIVSAPSNVDAAKAQVAAAQASWNKAKNDLSRMQSLSVEARSREQLDSAISAEKNAKALLEDAKAKLRSSETAPKIIASAKSNVESLAAQVKQAEADLAQAEKDLSDTKILASLNGHITKKSVVKGDFVQPAQNLFSIVGSEIWVVANFKETQLKKMKTGNNVEIHIDAFPQLQITGKVDTIQYGTGGHFSAFPAENATGNFVKVVQRVPVKIVLDKQPEIGLPIGVGMSVVPTVYER